LAKKISKSNSSKKTSKKKTSKASLSKKIRVKKTAPKVGVKAQRVVMFTEEDKLIAFANAEKNTEYTDAKTLSQKLLALNAFSIEKKRKFLELLACHGVATTAAKEAGISHVTAFKHRREDPVFAEAWEEALNIAKGSMEREVIRRGLEGVDKPLHHKGYLTGDTVKEYSDNLLMFQMKALDPDRYRENKGANIIINNTTEGMTDAELESIIKEGSKGKLINGESEVVDE